MHHVHTCINTTTNTCTCTYKSISTYFGTTTNNVCRYSELCTTSEGFTSPFKERVIKLPLQKRMSIYTHYIEYVNKKSP